MSNPASLEERLRDLAWPLIYAQTTSHEAMVEVLRAAARMALEEACVTISAVESDERARVTATDERGPIWANAEGMSSGIYHAGIYMRSAIRTLAATLGSRDE